MSKHRKKNGCWNQNCIHLLWDGGCFQSSLLIGKKYQLQGEKKKQNRSQTLLPLTWYLYRKNY